MKRVTVAQEARDEIRDAVAWWKANRPKGPRRLRDELRSAFGLLAFHPEVGRPVIGAPANNDIRFLVLRVSRFLLFYSVSEEEVQVLRLWQSNQGRRPFTR